MSTGKRISRKKLQILTTRIDSLRELLSLYTGKLRDLCELLAPTNEINQRIYSDLAKTEVFYRKKAGEMEEYYNERIRYYLCSGTCCTFCRERHREVLDIHRRYILSLEKIYDLRLEVERYQVRIEAVQPKP